MRLLQCGVAVSVVMMATMPAACAGATGAEYLTAACCLGDDTTAQLTERDREPLVAPGQAVVVGCCLGGDHGQQLNSTGLGQSHPQAVDLSLDAAWRVYGFGRDGAEYFQVNDPAGRVHLIVGSVDGLFWVLPAGETPTQVVLPPQQMPKTKTEVRVEIYRNPVFSLVFYQTDGNVVWSVEVPSTVR